MFSLPNNYSKWLKIKVYEHFHFKCCICIDKANMCILLTQCVSHYHNGQKTFGSLLKTGSHCIKKATKIVNKYDMPNEINCDLFKNR